MDFNTVSRPTNSAVSAAFSSLLLASALIPTAAFGADLGGSCCADLEERIAELEATTARKGNRKVSIKVSGQIHRVIMLWDDGAERNVYESDTSTWSSRVRFTGTAHIDPTWEAGYRIEISPASGLSTNLNQLDDDANFGGLRLARSFWFVNNKDLGRLSVGLMQEASDGASSGGDFSGTDSISGAGLSDTIGAFFLRRSGIKGQAGLVRELTWDSITLDDAGDGISEANVVRYDSPTFNGLRLAASWGEDDIWSVGLFYDKEIGDFEVGASFGYGETTDDDGICRQQSPLDPSSRSCSAMAGSLGFRHVPTGINATFSMGHLDDDFHRPGFLKSPDDEIWYYGKVGVYREFFPIGQTALYLEYYNGSKAVEELFAAGSSSFAAGNVFIRGSDVEIKGIGIVQDIDAAAAHAYLMYREFSVDLDAINPANGLAIAAPTAPFRAVVMGMRMEF
jgi:hypothetical protein